ncbi:MAG: hypothetical protein QOG00_251 [Pyrinomonadaceae bacterium]|nr:hypothetical protein [Pyrinomonadaceae bacterium]
MSEHHHQRALFEWADIAVGQHPELALLYAVPNGGYRTKSEAGRLRAEGVKAGVPDVCLPVARKGYHGAYWELKYGKGKPSAEQLRWHALLRQQGYYVNVCWDWVVVKQEILDYMKG